MTANLTKRIGIGSSKCAKWSTGWQIRACIGAAAESIGSASRLADLPVLLQTMADAMVPATFDPETGIISAVARSPAAAYAAAEALHDDFGHLLAPPTADMVNRGLQAAPRVWLRFRVAGAADGRFDRDRRGAAGVPFLADDMTRIVADIERDGLRNELAIDRAVFHANAALIRHHGEHFLGADADPDCAPPLFGWVMQIHAGRHCLDVAAELSQDGIQHRLARNITLSLDGKALTSVVVYAGSLDHAEHITDRISRNHGAKLHHVERGEFAARRQIARGIEAHFVPPMPNAAMTASAISDVSDAAIPLALTYRHGILTDRVHGIGLYH